MTSNLYARMRPEHKAAARSLGFALTIGDEQGWHDFAIVACARLTETERAALAYASLKSQPSEQASWTADAAIDGAAQPPQQPSFLDTPTGRAVLIEWRNARDKRRWLK